MASPPMVTIFSLGSSFSIGVGGATVSRGRIVYATTAMTPMATTAINSRARFCQGVTA